MAFAVSTGLTAQIAVAYPQLEFTSLGPNTTIAEPTGTSYTTLNIGVSLIDVGGDAWGRFTDGNCTVTGTVLITSESAIEGQDYRTPNSTAFSFSITPFEDLFKVTNSSKISEFDDTQQEIPFEVLADYEAESDETLSLEIANISAKCTLHERNGDSETIHDVSEQVVNATNSENEFGYGTTITIEDTFNERPTDPEGENDATAVPQEQISLKTQVQDMSNLAIHTGLLQSHRLGAELANIRKGKRGLNINNLQVYIDGTALPALPAGLWANEAEYDKGAGAGDTLDDFGRWGVFISGAINIGEQLNNDVNSEYSSSLILAGADYHVTDNFVAGAALGYTNLSSELDRDIASTEFSKTSYFAFISYYKENFYFDSIAGYGSTSYDLKRKVIDDNLQADTDGEELNASVGTGYQFKIKRSAVNLFALVNYIDVGVNAYSENTDGLELTAKVNNFNTQSLTSSLGTELSWPISTSIAIISPQLTLAWEHQYEGSPVTVSGNFVGEGISQAFELETSTLDKDYYNVQVGLTAAFTHGITSYLIYDTYADRDDLHSEMYSFGLRGQF